jgi:hypothetical protein
MPKAKNAPLLKRAPADLIEAMNYFWDGDLDRKAVGVVRRLEWFTAPDANFHNEFESAVASLRHQGFSGETIAEIISQFAKAVHAKDASFLRAVADVIDAHGKHPGDPADKLAYWMLDTYMDLCDERREAAGMLPPRNIAAKAVGGPDAPFFFTNRRVGRRRHAHQETDTSWFKPTNPPADPGPGLRPSCRDLMAHLREIPELNSTFAKLNPERRIREVAMTLGLKFGGRPGRPRKP